VEERGRVGWGEREGGMDRERERERTYIYIYI
jgi:hypothetical protein